jgi:hypothetical protein
MKKSFGLFCILTTAVSCKPSGSGSSLQTLDNFAAGSRVTTNECAGDPAFANDKGLEVALTALEKRIQFETKKPTEPMLEAIKKSFSAIPPDFQATFLELGGSIIVSSESNGLCTTRERFAAAGDAEKFSLAELKVMKEGFDQVSSCYVFMPPSAFEKKYKNKGQIVSIILPDNVDEIKHSFVRSFGYLVSQLYSRLVFVPGSDKVTWVSMENAKFRKKKDKIAVAFLRDVSKTSNKANFQEYLPGGKASGEDKRNFADFVYAEAFDSYFCNAFASGKGNTRETMRRDFRKTYNAFIGSSSEQGLSLKGEEELGKPADDTVNSAASSARNSIIVGRSRSFDNSPKLIGETLNRYNWYMLADKSSAKSEKSQGFGLWWNPLTAVSETFQGAGILYGEYYDRTQKATQKAFDAASSNGQSPGVLGTVSAIATGTSGGTGYTDVYNNIQQKTDRIYTQVAQGRGTDKPLGLLDTTSVVLNATVDQTRNVPGPIGTFMGAAQDGVTTFDGGKFDSDGKFKEATSGERLGAAVGLGTAVLQQSGATEAITNSVLGSGGMIKRFGQDNAEQLSGLGQAAIPAAGQSLQRINIVNNQLEKAFEAQNALGQSFQAVNGLNSFSGLGGSTVIPTNASEGVTEGIRFTTGMISQEMDRPQPSAQPAQQQQPVTPSVSPGSSEP